MSYDARIRNSRILIVDDSVANSTLLENVLNRLGFKEVRSLSDPRDVFGVCAEWKPDLMVLDLEMPHVSGYQILELLRNDASGDDRLPVLVLTAETDPMARRKALVAGAAEFMVKPFDSSEIVLRIRNLLLMHLLQSELRAQNRILEEKVSARTKALSERTQELERALEGLQVAQKQLVQQERFRAFSEMASGVVHDFNNSLTCVIGYTDLMLTSPGILDQRETVLKFIQAMNTAGHDASQIVGRLRNFYRRRTESEVLTVTDVNALMREVVPLTRPKWKANALATGRVIEVEEDLSEVPKIACNPAEIREVVVNLLFNAVDAMPKGGTVTLKTRTSGGRVSLGVTDTGTGMTEEVRQRCLEPFFSTKGEKGTGLGLAMVFGIVQRHEGEVEIESELNVGTTIWIHLRPASEEVFEAKPEAAPLSRSLHVLAVDDQQVSLDVVARYLQADGHTVVGARSAEEALRRLESEAFDLVITDHAMPGMTGSQLAAEIQGRSAPKPVILLTGCTELGFDSKELPHGVHSLLNKAVSQRDLRRAIAEVITTN